MKDIKAKPRIIVVDDELFNIELIEGYLESEYEIIPASNGQEALQKIQEVKPDVVLLDIMMPEITGYEVCAQIKQDESTRFIPVVLITALSDIEDKIKGIEAGADDFLTKPINSLELRTRVKSLLRIKYYYDQLIDSKEQIEAQNDFRTIMINILPILLQSIEPVKWNEVLNQMSKEVEKVIWTKYIHDIPAEIFQTATLSCNVMNKIGGGFSVEETTEKGYIIINNKCPWGEKGKINPALCMITKAIFARIGIRIYKNVNVDIIETIAGGDNLCRIKLYMGG
ncbi:MAG: response regulator [Candidatus Methanoperedens sp.]|nr:response regulator [Candidatus Methanoperedens sp.]